MPETESQAESAYAGEPERSPNRRVVNGRVRRPGVFDDPRSRRSVRRCERRCDTAPEQAAESLVPTVTTAQRRDKSLNAARSPPPAEPRKQVLVDDKPPVRLGFEHRGEELLLVADG